MGSNESTDSRGNGDTPSDNADGTNIDDRSLWTKMSGSQMAATGVAVAGAVAVAVAGAVAVGAAMVSSSDTPSERKTMKAPGRDDWIYRDVFIKDPKGYFRALRKKS